MTKKLQTIDILHAIQQFNAPVGASFLSNKLNVPQATIGRRLKELEDDGYLKSISNKGRMLTQNGNQYLEELFTLEVQKKAARNIIDFAGDSSIERILDILQIRRLLEPELAAQATLLMSDEQLRKLELLFMEHSVARRKGNIGDEEDLHLHLALAEYSQNAVAYHVLKLLLTENKVYVVLSQITNALTHASITMNHDMIINAIRNHDPDLVRVEMAKHLDRIYEDITEYKANCQNSDYRISLEA